MNMSSSNKQLTITCLCKASTVSLKVPESSLPLPVHLCHCQSCRHIFGALCCFHAVFPTSALPPSFSPSSHNLTKYQSSELSMKFFCQTCGSHMLDYAPKDDQWVLSTGVLDQGREPGILEFREHIFVGNTGDGGFADWLPSVAGKEMKRWKGYSNSKLVPSSWRDPSIHVSSSASPSATSGANPDRVHAFCHCKGVEFWITRPDPNLDPKESWFAFPSEGLWAGATCACADCARATGGDLTPMAFVHRNHIVDADGKPVTFPFGTMKIHKSSPAVERSFCGTCGAMIFYHHKERSFLVDVAPGLLDTPDARARDWVAYFDQWISFGDKAFNPALARDFRRGLIKFAEDNPGVMHEHGRKAWVPAEEREEEPAQ